MYEVWFSFWSVSCNLIILGGADALVSGMDTRLDFKQHYHRRITQNDYCAQFPSSEFFMCWNMLMLAFIIVCKPNKMTFSAPPPSSNWFFHLSLVSDVLEHIWFRWFDSYWMICMCNDDRPKWVEFKLHLCLILICVSWFFPWNGCHCVTYGPQTRADYPFLFFSSPS